MITPAKVIPIRKGRSIQTKRLRQQQLLQRPKNDRYQHMSMPGHLHVSGWDRLTILLASVVGGLIAGSIVALVMVTSSGVTEAIATAL